MRHFLLALTLLAAATPQLAQKPPTPASEMEAWNQPVPDWWEGPVRYALTDDETREYRSLVTRAERAAFIARFWASRDPNPYAAGNEAEETFWRRVSSADELFTQTTISGWRTDQGRVYIVLGPPDEITNYPVPSVDELDPTHFPDPYQRWPAGDLRPGHRGAVEWIYRSLKDPRADPQQLVTFLRDESGEYRLSGRLASSFRFEPTLFNRSMAQALQYLSRDPRSGRQRGKAFTTPIPGTPEGGPTRDNPDAYGKSLEQATVDYQGVMGSVEGMFAFGQTALFEKAEPPASAGAHVSTTQFFGVVLLQNRIDFFQGSGGTNALITLGVPSDDLKAGADTPVSLEIFGRLEKVDDPSHVYQFSTTRDAAEAVPLQDAGGREHRMYEVRGTVPPGEYRVNFGVRIGDRIGAVGDRVVVPDFSGESLRLAGPVLAEKISESSSSNGPKGFVLGQLRLLPKLDPVFPTGSDLGLYFQVYHATPDLRDGRLHLDIQYSVAARRKGIFVSQGKPVSLTDNHAPAHAFAFPLQGWSPGEYLLTVTITDRISGRVQTGIAPFLVQ